jgi:hypothetical protein
VEIEKKRMNQSNIVDQLDTSLRVLRSKWDSTRIVWNDVVSASFETTYIVPINQQAGRTLAKMQELAKVLSEAQRRVQ